MIWNLQCLNRWWWRCQWFAGRISLTTELIITQTPSSTAQSVGSFLVSIDFGRYAASWIRIDCRKGSQTCNCIIPDTISEEKKVTSKTWFVWEKINIEAKIPIPNFEMNISKIDYRKYVWTLSRDLFQCPLIVGDVAPWIRIDCNHTDVSQSRLSWLTECF